MEIQHKPYKDSELYKYFYMIDNNNKVYVVTVDTTGTLTVIPEE